MRIVLDQGQSPGALHTRDSYFQIEYSLDALRAIREVKFDLSRTTPPTLNQEFRQTISVPQTIISNTADWSRSKTAEASYLASARQSSFLIDRTAVSVQ